MVVFLRVWESVYRIIVLSLWEVVADLSHSLIDTTSAYFYFPGISSSLFLALHIAHELGFVFFAQSTRSLDFLAALPPLCSTDTFRLGTWGRWTGFLPPSVARSLCISTLSAQYFWLYWAYLWHRCINKVELFSVCLSESLKPRSQDTA